MNNQIEKLPSDYLNVDRNLGIFEGLSIDDYLTAGSDFNYMRAVQYL